MRTKLMVAIIATLAATGGALAGCASGDTANTNGGPGAGSAASSAPAGGAKAKPSCDLAPASLVNATLGTNVGDPAAQNLTNIVVCRYTSKSGTGSVVVRMEIGMSAATFATSRHISDTSGLPTSDLPGFADQAYTNVLQAGSHVTNTVVALKGNVSLLVSSPATFDAEKDLESQLFAKLT